jgi:hypothetical protein
MYGQPSFVNHNNHHLQVVVVAVITATTVTVIIIWYYVPMRHTVPTQQAMNQQEASIRMMRKLYNIALYLTIIMLGYKLVQMMVMGVYLLHQIG